MYSRLLVAALAGLVLLSAVAGQAVIQNEADGKSDINADFLDGYDRSAFLLASGDDLTGALNANYYRITNLSSPENPRDAAPKRYVDLGKFGNLSKTLSINNTAGDNDINMSGNEITNLPDSFDLSDAVDKEYVDTSDSTIEDDQGLGDVLGIDNRVEGEGINFDQSSSIQSAGTDVIRLDANQNIALPNDNLDMNGNNITNPNQVDGVDLDNPGNALSVNQDQLKVDTQGDIAAGSGLSGGNNNVLPGSDSDVTVSLNADDLDSSGNLQSNTVADNEISDNTVDNTEIQNSDSFGFQNLRKRVGFSVNSGSGTDFFKLGEARGRNFGGKIEVRRSVDQGNSDVSYQEVYISKRGGNANAISELAGTPGQSVEIIVTETSNDANGDGYNDAYIYAKCEDFCSTPITLEHSESFTKDFQNGLSSSDIVGNTVFNSISDLALRKTNNQNLDLTGNDINNIGGLQSCGDNQFVDGNGNCQDAGAAKTTARFTSTDTSTDINKNSWTVIPWNLQLDISSGYTHDPSGSPGQITFDESGTYKVHTMLTYDSGTFRINPGIKFSINGNRRDRLGLSGYSRHASGHYEASNYLTEMIDVNAGDTLRVEAKRFGNDGTVTLRDRESVLVIQKVSETVPKADDVDKVDGFDAADLVNKAGDTMTGNLNMNGNSITSDGNGVDFDEELYVDDNAGVFVQGEDLAERYGSSQNLEAGTIVRISRERNDSVVRTSESFDSTSGVVSTRPGYTLGWNNESEKQYPIALTGKVPVSVNMEGGEIERGDPIAPSSTPGVGMRCETHTLEAAKNFTEYREIAEQNRECQESAVGKALEPATQKTQILVKVDGK